MPYESLREQLGGKCRFFNGFQNATCEAGVAYSGLRRIGEALPCVPRLAHGKPLTPCATFALKTPDEIDAEIDEVDKAGAAWLLALAEGKCPTCGEPTEPERQVGRCVYSACGHRLYQGILSRREEKQGATR